jgi:hypothetical protein
MMLNVRFSVAMTTCAMLYLSGCAADKASDSDTATSSTTTATGGTTGSSSSATAATTPIDTGTWTGTPAVTACGDGGDNTEDMGGGVTSTWLDTADSEEWVCFSFGDGDWDLAVRQWTFRMNSGRSGDGSVTGARLEGVSFDEVTESPGGLAPDGEPPLFDGWYDYDYATHTLTPKGYVYVVDTPSGAYKVEIVSYYGPGDDPTDGGAVHKPWFRWAPLAGQ